MARKQWIRALVVLVASSLITLGILWSKTIPDPETAQAPSTDHTELYTLEGNGAVWRVEDYTVIRTKDSIWRGNAKLVYLGDSNEIRHSDYLSYTVYETLGSENEAVPVLSGSQTAVGGAINLLQNLEDLGSVESPITAAERNMIKFQPSGVYVVVEWRNSHGQSIRDRIPLEVL